MRFETDPGASFVEGPIPSSVAERIFASSNCCCLGRMFKRLQYDNTTMDTLVSTQTFVRTKVGGSGKVSDNGFCLETGKTPN